MSNALYELLKAIEEAEQASITSGERVSIDGWFEIFRLCKKLREEMARYNDDSAYEEYNEE